MSNCGVGSGASLLGVDASHRQVSRQQGSDDGALVATTRLDANCGDRQATQSLDQLAVTGGVVIHRKRISGLATPSRRDDPTLHRFHSSDALSSSCPFLADAGSCPGNCSGMEEATGAPSSFAVWCRGGLRASSRDGGGVVNRPPSPLNMLFSRHPRRRKSVVTSRSGSFYDDSRV